MKPEIEAVVRLQSLDDRAAELQKEIAALPKHVAEIERKLDGHTRRLEADRSALAANQKKRKALEDDIKAQEQKIAKLKEQTQLAKTNEQFRAFQNEVSYGESVIQKAEEQILELMTEGEPLEKNVKAAETALAHEKKAVDAEKEHVRKRTAEDDAALKSLMSERQALAASIHGPVLAKYERARKRWRNSGVADATEGRCSACNIALRPQYYQDLRHSESVMVCESCSRILYYNPPVSLEHEMHQKV
jgi:predicted  nucleic acid-binding Zn-ribbon protein